MKRTKKGFLDLSFSWIFALILGGMILFGAIYGVAKLTKVGNIQASGVVATDLTNVFNALDTNTESIYSVYVTMPLDSRVKNSCDLSGTFGRQSLSVEQKIKNKWTNANLNVYSYNQYVFSPAMPYKTGSKGYYAITKEFDLPFKVSNVIYLIPENAKYCFIDAPLSIKKELSLVSNDSIFEFDSCSDNSVKVCFNGLSSCNVSVNYNSKTVEKNGQTMYFSDDALMYGAIFSDQTNYECEVSRLIRRAGELSKIYSEKSSILQPLGCGLGLSQDMGAFKFLLENYNSSADLANFYQLENTINNENDNSDCRLW